MHPIRIARAALPLVALVALSASAAAAQSIANPERADHLQQRATELEQTMFERGPTRAMRLEAAQYHLESASARAVSDPQAVVNLIAAARHVGELDPSRSASLLHRAAEHAISIGDVETAAHAYIDAAVVLTSSKNVFSRAEGAQIGEWHHRAELLTRSPLLDESQRARITDRLFPATANAY